MIRREYAEKTVKNLIRLGKRTGWGGSFDGKGEERVYRVRLSAGSRAMFLEYFLSGDELRLILRILPMCTCEAPYRAALYAYFAEHVHFDAGLSIDDGTGAVSFTTSASVAHHGMSPEEIFEMTEGSVLRIIRHMNAIERVGHGMILQNGHEAENHDDIEERKFFARAHKKAELKYPEGVDVFLYELLASDEEEDDGDGLPDPEHLLHGLRLPHFPPDFFRGLCDDDEEDLFGDGDDDDLFGDSDGEGEDEEELCRDDDCEDEEEDEDEGKEEAGNDGGDDGCGLPNDGGTDPFVP